MCIHYCINVNFYQRNSYQFGGEQCYIYWFHSSYLSALLVSTLPYFSDVIVECDTHVPCFVYIRAVYFLLFH